MRETGGLSTRQSGYPAYMAPEILTKSHRHGTPADFWSLGTTMHELLYGLRPWVSTPRKTVEFLDICDREEDSSVRSPSPAGKSAKTTISLGPLDDEFRIMGTRAEGKGVPMQAHNFMLAMLETRPWCRLSTQRMLSLAEHPFFESMDWTALEQRQVTMTTSPPIVPSSSTGSISTKRRPASSQFQNPVVLEELKAQVNEVRCVFIYSISLTRISLTVPSARALATRTLTILN